jgi:hypothetical protein
VLRIPYGRNLGFLDRNNNNNNKKKKKKKKKKNGKFLPVLKLINGYAIKAWGMDIQINANLTSALVGR